MAHVIFCMSCCVRGDRIKSVPSIDQTARWQCWEPSNAHTIDGLGVGGMLTITCCYFCLQRPRCPNYSELIVSQSNFFVAISWTNTWRQAEVECSSSTSKGTGNPRNGSEFLPTELLGMRVKWTGTDGLPCLQHIVWYTVWYV